MTIKQDEWYDALRSVLRLAVSQHYCGTYPDTDGEPEAQNFDEVLQYERAKAWEEGFTRAHTQHVEHDRRRLRYSPCVIDENPYEVA